MLHPRNIEGQLKRELTEFGERYPRLSEDQLFVLWFLRAFVADSEEEAADALSGGPSDKDIDAIHIDHHARVVFLIQGKYRQRLSRRTEKRGDVLGFAQVAGVLRGGDEKFRSFCDGISPEVLNRLARARRALQKDDFGLHLHYVTTGKCSQALRREAERMARTAGGRTSLQLFDGRQVTLLLDDYLDGVAPPVPALDLELESGHGIKVEEVFHRYDDLTGIESWVISMSGQHIAELFTHAGDRLFARNVRGFLGDTQINRGMEDTLRKEPEFFWYYNNGITLVCDHAEQIRGSGRSLLRVTNPQVINGQQTTRTLSRVAKSTTRASILVRVIRIPRSGDGRPGRFESLVSRIVSATNWQNSIRPSDLMSNDRVQIEIERGLRKLGYWYVRKRQSKAEARRVAASKRFHFVRKDEFAVSSAGCDLDPAIVREGKEGLFEERLYRHVFPNSDPHYYLSRYWLMRMVGYVARGYPSRAYAKWLVLNFVWRQLGSSLRKRASAESFRTACERSQPSLRPLKSAISAAFVAALRFYHSSKGAGAKAADISTFFQRRNLDREFLKFWKSPSNRSRASFQRQMSKFVKALSV